MIKITEIVSETYTNASGYSLYMQLEKFIKEKQPIQVSFRGVSTSSSFLNSSFGALIDKYGVDNVKNYIKPTEISSVQANMLKSYVNSFIK